ncbi:MAG: EamA family transporter [Deltaproteobacteria bacterium]|nr:MAG: EamA family transporter [Deltaproteobacteria bacterium]
MTHCGIHCPMKLHNASGNLAAFIAAGLFGASVVATRVAVQEIPPLNLAILRFGQGGLILFLCLFFGARNLLKVKQHDLPFLVLLGAILFAMFPVTFNISLRFTEASRGALMLATMPIWSAWIARVARKERLNPRQIAGILFTFTGVGIVLAERGLNWQGSAFALAGDGLMLLTALCGAIYGVLAQRMLARYSALVVTMYAMLFGTFLLFPAAILEGFPQTFIRIDGKIAILILFLGVFGGALAFYLWTFALTRLTPTQVAVYVNVNPLVAIVLGAALLTEKLTGVFVVGFVAVVVGVLFVNWPRGVESELHFSEE